MRPPSAAFGEGEPRVGASHRLTILVLEDDPINNELVCLMLARILGEEACRFARAATGAEALRLATDERPDLITLDLNLPGMDGGEVLKRLGADPDLAGVPVIVLSAWPYTPEAGERPAAVLEKPVSLERLRQAVWQVLGEPGAPRAIV